MNILFVWPSKCWFSFKPISLALFSAKLKEKGHSVRLYDTTFLDFGFQSNTEIRTRLRVFKPVDYGNNDLTPKKVDIRSHFLSVLDDFAPDLIAFSVLSDEIFIAQMLSAYAKEWNPSVPVLWGNKGPTMAPEKILQDGNIDYACIGEGIEFLPAFIDALASGSDPRELPNIAYRAPDGAIVKNPLRPYFQDLDSLPHLDLSIYDQRHFLKPYDGKLYIGCDHMIYWGCPHLCTFCINHAYRKLYSEAKGKFLRCYSVDRIIAELKYLKEKWGITLFHFHDEDFCLKPLQYFKYLCEQYIKHVGTPFVCMANAKNINVEKVNILKKMGCVSISVGIETGNDVLRKKVLKRHETKEDIVRAIRLLSDAKIRTSSFNMLGIPFETRQTILETIELNRAAGVQYPNTVFFYPLENTELRRVSVDNGFFDERFDRGFDDVRPSLTLPTISEEELIALRERFNLYVKLPQELHPFIERSEAKDATGELLTQELFSIYEVNVLNNNGFWSEKADLPSVLHRLEQCSQA